MLTWLPASLGVDRPVAQQENKANTVVGVAAACAAGCASRGSLLAASCSQKTVLHWA